MNMNKDFFINPMDQSLFNSRVIQLSGEVNAPLAKEINKTLFAMEAVDAEKPIYLFINSPGGEVHSGFAIFDVARFIEPKVITVVAGLAASMGSLIALCAKKEDRYAFVNSKFLIHQPLVPGVIRGQASDLEIHARDIIQMKQRINEIYAEETGRPYDEISEVTDRDKWLTPNEALEFGLIKKIVERRSEIK
jgi:ATP-dependent Clp protease, protease subunit